MKANRPQLGAYLSVTSPNWGFLSKFRRCKKSQVIVFIDNFSVGVTLACHIFAQRYTVECET